MPDIWLAYWTIWQHPPLLNHAEKTKVYRQPFGVYSNMPKEIVRMVKSRMLDFIIL